PPHGRVDVGDAVGEREAELLGGRTTCLAHVVAADRDRVPARNVLGAEGEHVGDDAERGRGRIDVGAARGILLEHVVLDGAADLRPRDTLLLSYREVEAEEDHPRRVDGHRGGDAIERNTGEQRLHVVGRVEALQGDVRGGAEFWPPFRGCGRPRLTGPARVGGGGIRLAYRHGG